MNEKLPILVPQAEQERISRALLAWLNEYPDKPVNIINYEYLADDVPGMALSTIQGAYKTKEYVRGGYQAQYQFKLIYRIQAGPGADNNNRLSADELLDIMGDWIAWRTDVLKETPYIGDQKKVQRIVPNTRSALFGRYENGDEDHQILMTMYYISM